MTIHSSTHITIYIQQETQHLHNIITPSLFSCQWSWPYLVPVLASSDGWHGNPVPPMLYQHSDIGAQTLCMSGPRWVWSWSSGTESLPERDGELSDGSGLQWRQSKTSCQWHSLVLLLPAFPPWKKTGTEGRGVALLFLCSGYNLHPSLTFMTIQIKPFK